MKAQGFRLSIFNCELIDQSLRTLLDVYAEQIVETYMKRVTVLCQQPRCSSHLSSLQSGG